MICTLCKKNNLKDNRARCQACNTKIRRHRTKQAAVKLLGSKCVKCGWSGNILAFEFHHLRDKEFNVSGASNKSWVVLRKEVEKCELLCSNCHRIEHSNRNEEFLKEVNNYKGSKLDI